MNIALITISSLSLVCSAGCLAIMLKGASEAKKVKTDVETFKAKTDRNIDRVKTALAGLEF